MNALIRSIRKKFFGISEQEILFERRRFQFKEPRLKTYLEERGAGFVTGYNIAVDDPEIATIGARLDESVAPHDRGFAYEGAAMALYLFDVLTPWRAGLFQKYIEGPAHSHLYMAYVGAGWAIARVGFRPERHLRNMDPVLGWLAMDGYGFHEVFFHPERMIEHQAHPKRVRGYARNAFDQGLGRGLWFALGADVPTISETICTFESERHADLWGGVGLACAYAGGLDEPALTALREKGGSYRTHLAQGTVFAAMARDRAGNRAPHTDLACRVFCGLSSEAAIALGEKQRKATSPGRPEPVYEQWRANIRSAFERPMVYNEAETSAS